MAIIKLQSSDGEVFVTDVDIAKSSGTLRAMLEDAGLGEDDESIVPLPAINSDILRLVLQWIEHDHYKKNIDTTDDATLFKLISAAKYLDIKGLLHSTCKAVASKIKNKSTEELRKRFKIKNDLNREGEKEEREATPSEETSAAMKVPVDDWEDIFDYVLQKDLISMGKTCKRMQKIVGWYCKTFGPNGKVFFSGGLIKSYCEVPSFISISEVFGIKKVDFRFIGTNFKSIKTIKLIRVDISSAHIEQIKESLKNVECVHLEYCVIDGDFHEMFLKWCVNLRTLIIESNPYGEYIIGSNNSWLLQKYPKLENVDLQRHSEIVELYTFLEQNPNLKTFGMSGEFYETYVLTSLSLMEANFRLETLKLHNVSEGFDLNMLNALHDRGLYNRLHLESLEVSVLPPFRGLEEMNVDPTIQLSHKQSIKTVRFTNSEIDNFESFVENLIGVEIFDFCDRSYKQEYLLKVLHKWPTLKKIQFTMFNEEFLDMPALNAERNKLVGARKVTIILSEKVYTGTKMRFGDQEFSLVEFKRDDQYWFLF